MTTGVIVMDPDQQCIVRSASNKYFCLRPGTVVPGDRWRRPPSAGPPLTSV